MDPRPSLPCPPLLFADIASEIGLPAKLERIYSEQLSGEVVLHVVAHSFDDRDDGNEEHHTDRHAEKREEALQLLHADLREREPDGVEERHGAVSATCEFRR